MILLRGQPRLFKLCQRAAEETRPGDVSTEAAALATRFADAMLAKGVYVIGFSYPVVPKGRARIRTQISAAHSEEELAFAVEKFAEAKKELNA